MIDQLLRYPLVQDPLPRFDDDTRMAPDYLGDTDSLTYDFGKINYILSSWDLIVSDAGVFCHA